MNLKEKIIISYIFEETYSIYIDILENSDSKDSFIKEFIISIQNYCNKNSINQKEVLSLIKSISFKEKIKKYLIQKYQQQS